MARQFTHLFASVIDFENLYRAYRKAAKGKRGHPSVATFEWNLERNLLQLKAELGTHSYQPGPYQSFMIRDPKHRRVSAAPFRDRVVHHALVQVIEPAFEATFIGDSYANRIGKGNHKALHRAQQLSRKYRYVLQADVVQFFASIDHEILYSILQRKIADKAILRLCWRIMLGGKQELHDQYQMHYFPGDDLLSINRQRGLPIGNLTSQFWANVYLNELDQFVKRKLRCQGYVRYMDDCLLFADDKRQLWQWREAVIDYMQSLRLILHTPQCVIYPVVSGIPFLGFRVYPAYRRIKRRNAVAFVRRTQQQIKQMQATDWSWDMLNHSMQGWVAHAKHGDTHGLRRSLFKQIGASVTQALT